MSAIIIAGITEEINQLLNNYFSLSFWIRFWSQLNLYKCVEKTLF